MTRSCKRGSRLAKISSRAGSVMEGTASSKGKKQTKQGLVQKVTHYLSSGSWDTETGGVFWLQDTKGSFIHCQPGSVWSFSPGCKAMPRRASSCRSTASLWPDLPWSVTLCNSSSPIFTEPSSKPFENWSQSQSQAASLFIDELFLRGTQWNYLLGKTSPNVRLSAGLSIFLIPSDIHFDCHFATVQYITDVFFAFCIDLLILFRTI